MSFIGEAALSAVIDALFGKLSDDLLKTIRKENFDADLKKWERMLLKIQAVLDDAEEKQVTSRLVKIWLADLEDLAYDVDDILDELATEALRRELNPEPKNKLQKLIDACLGSNRDFVKLMRSKIEGIDRRLQNIVEEKKDLELRENTGGRTITKTSRPPSTSLVNESRTYGRDEDKKEIVKLLLESSDAQLSVIPIVGMGGLGKTTLAQLVYKDDEVCRHFDLKAWVCVSEDFDNLRLTREILHSVTSESCDGNNNLDSLQGQLKNTLSGKKFLLVLDDVWNENYELWTELRKPFEFGVQGSKIVVTTRNFGVSSMMGTVPPYKLEELSHDACLRVFTHHALDATDFSKYPELEEFGQKIVNRCKGVPLAAKVLGGLLRSKHDPYEWEDVLNSKIWDISEDKSSIFSVLKLRENTGGWTITTRSRVPATSLVESHTYGREEDIKAIVKLLSDESGGAQLSTISILGVGGLGKTTLAKLVYNDDKVGSYFDVKAWVCVSENFDILRVTKEILQDITSETCKDDSLNLAQRKLKEQLSGKKFLLILDDVWIENYSDWTKLRLPFESGAPGSKILITTRVASVSSTMGATHPYKLRELSDDACLTMFTQHALGTSDFGEHLKVEERQKILERCKGLPLAAKALAGFLRTYDHDEWKDVLNGRIWDLLGEKTDVFLTLRLSYLCLPSSLKRCFAYCSLFPKDYYFEEKELVLLWMAEGLVRGTREKPMEDLGGEYFHDLLKRSFFQQSSSNESLFVMHDLMHDLAQWAAGDFCYRLEDQLGGSEISTKVRHFSYFNHSSNCIKKLDDFSKDMHLRTFLLQSSRFVSNLTNFDAICLLPQLRCLRVLSLSGNDLFELPSSIGDLKHLRYLNLSYTKIESLPESTSSLYNLQTLILKGCDYLTKLPEKIENLVNLRHLNISYANSIREMPAGIAKLKSLQKLCFGDMHEWQHWIPCRVECEEFPCLRELSISNCPKLEGKFPHHLPSLEKLSIDACEKLAVLIPSPSELQVLNIVNCGRVVLGSLKVEKLKIEKVNSLRDDKLMSLVAREIEIKSCGSLVNIKLKSTLRTLTIGDCGALKSLEFMMDKGSSHLQDLKIYDCRALKCVSAIVDSSAMLKRLDIDNCRDLTSLSSKESLPTTLRVLSVKECPKLELIVNELDKDTLLEVLVIQRCEKLRRLPRGLHELCHLAEIRLRELNISFPKEGFHTNLRVLGLSGENLCKQIFELGLHRLTMLTYLWIYNGIMDSFPEKEDGEPMLMLPKSLTTLRFSKFPNLEFLSWKFFQNLSALEQISIRECPKLASLSEKCFPPSLQLLYISDCPVLKQNCEKDKGIMWSKIANIPKVTIY